MPEEQRKLIVGNWQRRTRLHRIESAWASGKYASDELQLAAQKALEQDTGRKRVSVPMDTLTSLVKQLAILQHQITQMGAYTGIVGDAYMYE